MGARKKILSFVIKRTDLNYRFKQRDPVYFSDTLKSWCEYCSLSCAFPTRVVEGRRFVKLSDRCFVQISEFIQQKKLLKLLWPLRSLTTHSSS